MSIHDGHRARLKKQFLESGLDSLSDIQKLEFMLCFAIPRMDVNPIAHALLDRFKTLSAVFDAPMSELVKVQGVGDNAATLIKLFPQMSRAYLVSRAGFDSILDSTKKAGEYMSPYFFGERDEVVYMACLDAKCKVINCKKLFHGGVNSANISIRKIVENALLYNATSVIIAHNHTSGIALPSEEDKQTTRQIEQALRHMDIILMDHIIVADDDFVSLADNGFFRR